MKRYEKIQQWANNGHFKYQRKKQNPQAQSTKGFAGNITGDPNINKSELTDINSRGIVSEPSRQLKFTTILSS